MNKLNKILSFFLVFILSFIFINKVEAATLRVNNNAPEPFNGSGLWYNIPGNSTYGIAAKTKRYFSSIQVFSVLDGNTVSHAYCVQPGVHLTSGATASPIELSNWVTPAMAQNISYILTYGYAIDPGTADEFNYRVSHLSLDNYYKIIATQSLVWEVMTGDRNTLSIHAPNVSCMNNRANCYANGLFMTLSSSGDSRLRAVWSEYTSIIDAVRFSFLDSPAYFSTAANAPTSVMAWDGSKYTITYHDSNNAYKYFTIGETSQGVSASISADGSSLTITSNKALSSNTPASVEIRTKGNRNYAEGNKVYVSDQYQNLTKVGISSASYYSKVSTPLFQLKITKKATLDNILLSGAKFKVCSNKSCTNVLGTITTNSNGIATYTNLPAPVTYYIQEIEAPAGYELNSTPMAVSVTTANVSGSSSFASVIVKDTNKEFNLTKTTVDEDGKTAILNDGCGTSTYTGPEFELKNSKGDQLYFLEMSAGKYNVSSKDVDGAVSKIKTCNGSFKVYTLPECSYVISETKAPEGLTLPATATKKINVCGSDKNVSFTNGYTGLEFQKKDEDGNFVTGGKFALQQKVNNVYKDMLLKQNAEGNYTYVANLKSADEGATYIMLTSSGISRISKLPPGEYRVVEKEAPEGYEAISDKNSTAVVTIKDADKGDYYLVELINQKVTKNGGRAAAELIVAINTGRRVPNYILIISILAVLLVAALIIRKKIKK